MPTAALGAGLPWKEDGAATARKNNQSSGLKHSLAKHLNSEKERHACLLHSFLVLAIRKTVQPADLRTS